VSIIIQGDQVEGTKWLGLVKQQKNQLERIYAPNNPFMQTWEQLSPDVSVHIFLQQGKASAIIFAGVQKIYVTIMNIYRTDQHFLYDKFDKYATKDNYPSGANGWLGKNNKVMSWDQESNGTSYNRFRVYLAGASGTNLMGSLTLKVLSVCLNDKYVVVIAEDGGNPILNKKEIAVTYPTIAFVDNIDVLLALPPLGSELGTGSYWFLSEFSPDGKSICLVSKIVANSTRQEVNIITFSSDYSTYATSLVYNKAIVSVTTTTTTVVTGETEMGADRLATRTGAVNLGEPYIVMVKAEGSSFCALRQNITEYHDNAQAHEDITGNFTRSSVTTITNTLEVISIIPEIIDVSPAIVNVEFTVSIPQDSIATSAHRPAGLVTDTFLDERSSPVLEVAYYSAINKAVLYKNYISHTKDYSDGGTIYNSFGSLVPRKSITKNESELCAYANNDGSVSIASKDYVTPTAYSVVSNEPYFIGLGGDAVSTSPKIINIAGIFHDQTYQWSYLPYHLRSAYNEFTILYCFNLLYPLGGIIGPFGYTAAIDIKTGLNILVNERLDLLSSAPLTYTPISITN